MSHPSQRFAAPATIPRGSPLKSMLNAELITLIAESFAAVYASFDRRGFVRQANDGLESLDFSERGQHIGRALAERLPEPFAATSKVLIDALGPELTTTERNGLAVFFYLPHAYVISERGVGDFAHGMLANYELTKRFTAEYSVRPFLVQHRDQALRRLREWTSDPNPHVRRLVSEGTRPRLPWAMRLKEFQRDPTFTLPLLELLKDDRELYVRRSVANHLADVLKDHPDAAYAVCERWLDEVRSDTVQEETVKQRHWIIRHSVRLPAKKGDRRALSLRAAAKGKG